jgi:hypothetical protein
MANGENPFADWLSGGDWGSLLLAEMPQAAYYSSPAGGQFAGESPRRRRFYEQNYQDIYGDWLGEIGVATREARQPATFEEFLETNPWTARYGRLPQAARGMTGMRANPRTRFLFNY